MTSSSIFTRKSDLLVAFTGGAYEIFYCYTVVFAEPIKMAWITNEAFYTIWSMFLIKELLKLIVLGSIGTGRRILLFAAGLYASYSLMGDISSFLATRVNPPNSAEFLHAAMRLVLAAYCIGRLWNLRSRMHPN